ncbi:hypothetical protein NLI96_g5882 [Meripilus lineatus]|uniref:Prolyl 4-hydroxylase alpha subunit Fe(2+) 2OG dioxygenase domain-containing protein n=1 Tax=Meripilus lineatus TaxID=2056292 RepID=A0AAD5YDI1_9APHY|nr:hypothetical protein NLI96_g5882 [Physisporinus lineatus]
MERYPVTVAKGHIVTTTHKSAIFSRDLAQHSDTTLTLTYQMDEEESSISPEDIRSGLEEALSTRLDFIGAFSFSKTFTDAPNPSLDIQGLGTIGVPLSNHDAEAIKSMAEQAPFGMGAKSVIDKTVRDTWEIDAKLITFGNPRWTDFMQNSVKQAWSHFLPHVDTEKVDGMFATVVVVLPSRYTGGTVCVSHNGVDITYDCSQTSLNTTTVMAWYTDVMHEIKPITSGYRLAISFNLIHTTNFLRPALATNAAFIGKVKEVLDSWVEMQEESEVLEKIVFLLDHRYSKANLRGSALKGMDDLRVSLLQQVCNEVGFSLGLATVVCRLVGTATGDGAWRDSRRRHYSPDEDDNDDIDFEEIDEREVTIEDFVDLDGTAILDKLPVDEETELIPLNPAEEIEYEDPDKEEYQGYMGNYPGTLERWYRRTALVIWPEGNSYYFVYRGQGLRYACHTLDKEDTPDVGLADWILSRAAKLPTLCVPAVCRAAIRWNDNALWGRAVKALFWYERRPLLDNEGLGQAFDAFGFEGVNQFLDYALKVSPRSKDRLDLITRLEALLKRYDDEENISSWIQKQRDDLFCGRTFEEKAHISKTSARLFDRVRIFWAFGCLFSPIGGNSSGVPAEFVWTLLAVAEVVECPQHGQTQPERKQRGAPSPLSFATLTNPHRPVLQGFEGNSEGLHEA